MKKLALALVASAVSLSAANANISTGFYLGATAGYGATTSKITGTDAANRATTGSTDFGSNAANIGLIGGYGWVAGCMYYGGEIGYTFENTKVRSTAGADATTGSTELKRNGYFNAALRGGYLFTPNTMFYVRLGMNWGKWTLNDSLNNDFTNARRATGSKNRMSFVPGVGLETAIHKNVYLRVEYNYEFGPSVRAKANNVANAFTNVGSIRSQSAKIGLAYKF